MKKILILSVSIFLFAACNSSTNTKQDDGAATPESSKTNTASDGHNAKNSLDYKGIYTAEISTASGSGMKVKIELGDDTYKKEVTHTEKKDTLRSEGKYSWDATGSIITLDGDEIPNMYKVGENTLTRGDIIENKFEGNLDYILKKQ